MISVIVLVLLLTWVTLVSCYGTLCEPSKDDDIQNFVFNSVKMLQMALDKVDSADEFFYSVHLSPSLQKAFSVNGSTEQVEVAYQVYVRALSNRTHRAPPPSFVPDDFMLWLLSSESIGELSHLFYLNSPKTSKIGLIYKLVGDIQTEEMPTRIKESMLGRFVICGASNRQIKFKDLKHLGERACYHQECYYLLFREDSF